MVKMQQAGMLAGTTGQSRIVIFCTVPLEPAGSRHGVILSVRLKGTLRDSLLKPQFPSVFAK